ncbi:MAG: ABC transporter ATP-binding protein [Clostridiales bacterium]|nr:ABC transporter ATP-binding protein [Clostridiales bacterium]
MLKITDLKKEYGSFRLNCSLEVPAGCITGLVGMNGAGKSTIIKAVLGLISTDGGAVELLGKKREELTGKDKEKLGIVLSDSGFSGYLTGNNVLSVLSAMYSDFDKKMFLEYCRRYELPLDKPLKEFSTGMKAKMKVLAAISHKADFLLLDEPTNGLDVLAREDLVSMLQDYMEENENRSILISSHISSDLEGLCDDLYMIHNGEIVFHENMDALLGEYAVLKVTGEQYRTMDRQYLLRTRKESYGYSCLTDQKQFYMENYPEITIENGNVNETIALMVRGEKL